MESFFTDTLGFSSDIFSFLILPLLIFLARICDVSINTIRIIYMLGGRRFTATLLGFFEAFIWLLVIREIFKHLDNWLCYVAYPAGFACGIFVGMIIEEKIAYGKVIVRIITRKDVSQLIQYLNLQHFRFTKVNAEGPDGNETLVFTVLERERLDDLLNKLKELIPTAFYTIEKVKAAAESGALPEERGGLRIFTWLRGVIRN
ncbi:MAG TPA: cyclic-di-AMP receptor [Cyclobacteriaceae bacterium]|nr:cyclic-di-AMP receptor [Cyclobacteriaceae bacterium]